MYCRPKLPFYSVCSVKSNQLLFNVLTSAAFPVTFIVFTVLTEVLVFFNIST